MGGGGRMSGGGPRMSGGGGGYRSGGNRGYAPRSGAASPRGYVSGPRGGGAYVGPRGGVYVGPRGGYGGYGYGGWGGRGWYGGYGGYGYSRPVGWCGGWGWGWGWGGLWGFSPWWGWGGYWAGYPYPYAGGAYIAPGGSVTVSYSPGSWAAVKVDVSPEEARVFLDGRYIGTADDFDGFPDMLYLQSKARYQLEFRLEGFETQSVDVDAQPGAYVKLDNKLKKIPGAKQYGSYDTPEPEGGVQRFFGKAAGGSAPVSPDSPSGGSGGNWRVDDSPATQAPPPSSRVEMAPPGTIEGQGAQAPSSPAPSTPASPQRGRIQFRVQPADAAVYVDDHFAGTAEELSTLLRGLQVAPGPHKIVVSRPGYATDASQVDVAPGATERVEISLDKP